MGPVPRGSLPVSGHPGLSPQPNSAKPQPHTWWAGTARAQCPWGGSQLPTQPTWSLGIAGSGQVRGEQPQAGRQPPGLSGWDPRGSLRLSIPPCRAALPWCWAGPRRPGGCWSTSSTTSSSRVRGRLRGAGCRDRLRGAHGMGGARGLSPAPPSGPCPQLLERGSGDRGRQPAREDTGVSAGGCAWLRDKQAREPPCTPGTLGELGPVPGNRPLHQSQSYVTASALAE